MISIIKTNDANITTPNTLKITVINPSDNPQLDNIVCSHSAMELTGSIMPTLLVERIQPKYCRTKRLMEKIPQPFEF
jgi:hypothetical protein